MSTLLRAEIDVGEALDDLVQQPRGLKARDLQVELVLVEDLAGAGGEAVVVVGEVACDVGRVGADRGEVLPGQVVELQASAARYKIASRFWTLIAAFFAHTASLVGAITQSSRRSTVNGRMTLPYSDCL